MASTPMLDIIQIGPVALNAPFVLLVAGYLAASAFLKLLQLRNVDSIHGLQSLLETSIVTGVIGARLIFVLHYWSAFAAKPWTVVYFWQGGFNLTAGIVSATVAAVILSWRHKLPVPGTVKFLAALAIVGAVFLGGGFGLGHVQQAKPVNLSALLPTLHFQTPAGQQVTTQALLGQPLVLNFWATWCPPCRREMPLLEELYPQLAADGISLVTINVGESVTEVQAYLHKQELTLPVLLSAQTSTAWLFAELGGQVMPTTYFFRANGELVQTSVGELSAATLLQGVEKMQPLAK